MRRHVGVSNCVLLVLALAIAPANSASIAATSWDYAAAKAFLQQHCVRCHLSDPSEGDFDASSLLRAKSIATNLPRWHDILDQIATRQMPPVSDPQVGRPAEEVYQTFEAWLRSEILRATEGQGRRMRRLNRAEYNNTIRDLFQRDLRPADAFPQDLGREGFDNVAEAQSVSPILLQKYLQAAEEVLALTLGPKKAPEQLDLRFYPVPQPVQRGEEPLKASTIPLAEIRGKNWLQLLNQPVQFLGANWAVDNRGGLREGKGPHGYEARMRHDGQSGERTQFRFDAPQVGGRYRLTVRAYAELAKDRKGNTVPRSGTSWLGVDIDGVRHSRYSVPLIGDPQTFTVDFHTQRSRTQVYLSAATVVGKKTLAGIPPVVITEARLEGPLYETWPPANQEAILGPAGEWSDLQVIFVFASRAFRRPATEEEVAKYFKIGQQEAGFGATRLEALRASLQAILVSPHFLYMIEQTRPDGSLSDFELATRLSYFLWSSMPDNELTQLAIAGRLQRPSVLRAQVRRMLTDPKAEALVENFAAQWIGFRQLDDLAPDPTVFRTWDEDLRAAMREEPEAFFRHVLRENLSLDVFLDADFTFVNERLAKHYELPGVEGGEMRLVRLPEQHPRGGLVTQAAVLTLASQPTRSSPVFRGKFVVSKLFNREPPNPPADVPPLVEQPALSQPRNLREQLDKHAEDPRCAACHAKIDPWGIALESFDGIGHWRDVAPSDLATELPSGREFTGPAGLKEVLLERRQDFYQGLTEKMLVYALGRSLTLSDREQVPEILTQLQRQDARMHAFLEAIVLSQPFRSR